MSEVLTMRQLGKRDGFDLVAYKMADEDASTDDADCYDEDDVAEHQSGDWSFVGVVVKAFRDGIELGEAALWSVEDGYLSGAQSKDNPSGYVSAFGHTLGEHEGDADLPAEAIAQAKAAWAKLCRDRRAQLRRWPVRRRVTTW